MSRKTIEMVGKRRNNEKKRKAEAATTASRAHYH